ncbi:MAG: hypothetical protein H6505_03275 [Calditrichaeota bacterium]|nr:hypothetical protein [Calditrichota bacterium]
MSESHLFSPEAQQEVLEALFRLATEKDSVPAIKLYLELAQEQSPAQLESLTLIQALELLRNPEQSLQTNTKTPEQGLQTTTKAPEQGLQTLPERE